jgi:hypothetical protein
MILLIIFTLKNHPTMKRTSLILILSALFAVTFGQDYTEVKDKGSDNEIKTLFKKSSKETELGWTLGLNSGYTQFDKKNVWLAGMTAGAIVNHNLTLGLQFNAVVNSSYLHYDSIIDNTNAHLVGGYGGFLVAYTLLPKSPVHITFPFQIGGGYLGYLSDNGNMWDHSNGTWNGSGEILGYDIFFFVEPGIQLELNLTKSLRLALGASYRYSPNFTLENQGSGFINQFNGTVGLKFGKF